jgi:hypothetical protein
MKQTRKKLDDILWKGDGVIPITIKAINKRIKRMEELGIPRPTIIVDNWVTKRTKAAR